MDSRAWIEGVVSTLPPLPQQSPGPPASLSLKTPEPRQLQSQPCALSPPALSGLNPEPERSPAGPPAHVCFPETSRTEGLGRGAKDARWP